MSTAKRIGSDGANLLPGSAQQALVKPATKPARPRWRDPLAKGATHAVFPSGADPRFLVPLGPARASSAAVRNYTMPSSARLRAVLRVTSAVSRLGAMRIAPRVISLGGSGTFLQHLQEKLDEELVVAVHLGPPRANRKPVLHLMNARGESLAYAKLGVNELTSRRVRREAEALRLLGETNIPGLLIPTLLATDAWNDLDYVVMSLVPTWASAGAVPTRRRQAKDATVAAFPTARMSLGAAAWWLRTMDALNRCEMRPDAGRLRTAATRLEQLYGDVAILEGAGHGDWTPWNMSMQVDALAVWDWERFALDVPVGWDEIHFAVAAHQGGAAAGLAYVQERTMDILGGYVGSRIEAKATLAAYLVHRGTSFIVDRQGEAGAPNGPLDAWLLPALEELVGLEASGQA